MSQRFNPMKIEPVGLTDVLARPDELPDVQEFRIASYNCWNLFGEEHDLNSRQPSPPKPEEQLDALAEMIRGLDADAIAFQEVQNEKTLAQLFRKRVNPKIDDPERKFSAFICIPSHDPRGINVALATRFAVRGSITFHDREFGPLDDNAVRFSRDLLGVDLFATPSYRFLFFVAHLKSKIGGDAATDKRKLEAKEIREILEEPQFGGNPYLDQDLVVCGDMNDDPDSAVAEVLTRGGNKKELRDVLGPFKSYPTHKKYKKTRLDYILASPSLQIQDPLVHEEDPAAEASDHYPVSATVRVRKQ